MISFSFADIYGYEGESCGTFLPDGTMLNENSGYGIDGKINPDLIIMQFTGLRDKNGKEIYEGDIVSIPNWSTEMHCPKCHYKRVKEGRAEISFSNKAISEYGIRSRASFTIKIDFEEYTLEEAEHYEVIGNIYENPELFP
jgi:uncharacterized phage protein (TIGR01671 family)